MPKTHETVAAGFEIRPQDLYETGFPIRAQAMHLAMAKVRNSLGAAAMEAFKAGHDFAYGPLEYNLPDPFNPASLFEPVVHSVECRAGPVPAGTTALPVGFTIIRVSELTEGELARIRQGRYDWPENRWEDHCGITGCPQCEKDPTVI